MAPLTTLLLATAAGSAHLAAASFSLNVSGPDWDYTIKDLAPTTSQACKDAFSAPIACDATLLGIVASMRPAFNPGPADLARTCVPACADSIDAWIAAVGDACAAPGDRADVAVSSQTEQPGPPVATVGEVFRYTYREACAVNT